MFKTILKSWLRHLNFWTKFLLITSIVLMSVVGALVLRLQKGPLDLEFAKPYIENALSDEEKGYRVEIQSANLIWPKITEPLLINLTQVGVRQEKRLALLVNDFSFSLSGRALLKGKILPAQIIITTPAFRVFERDGHFNAFWKGRQHTPKEIYGPVRPRDIRDNIKDVLAQISNSASGNIRALSALKRVQIKNAIFVDSNAQRLADLNLVLKKHEQGLVGNLEVIYPKRQEKIARFRSDVLYRREEKDLTFTASLTDFHTENLVPFFKNLDVLTQQNLLLEGDVKAAFGADLKLQQATMNFSIPEGDFVVPGVYDEPVSLKNSVLKAQLDRSRKKLEVTEFKTTLGDVEIKANTIARFEKGNVTAPIEIKIDKLPLDKIEPIFPKSYIEGGAGQWLTKKLSKGYLHDIVVQTDLKVHRDKTAGQRNTDFQNTKLFFKAQGVTVQYSPTLKPVSDVVGSGGYEDDTLTIEGESGKIGDLTGKKLKLKITDLTVPGGGKADINLDVNGPLRSALNYVSDEPISAGDALGFDIKKVEGNVDFNLQLNFPTIKDLPKDQVEVSLKGKAHDLLLPAVVRGLSVTGGPYDLTFDKGKITLKGKGKLDGRDIDLNWMQYLNAQGRDYSSKIEVKVTADEDLRSKFGVGLDEYIDGLIPVDVVYIDRGKTAHLDIKGDLTPSILRISPFKYFKDKGRAGDLSLTAYLNEGDLKEINNLKIKAPDFEIGNGKLFFKKLPDGTTDVSRGGIPNLKLNKTRTNVEFEITPSDLLKVVLNGSVFDMTPFIKADKSEKINSSNDQSNQSRAMHVSIQANKMLADNGTALTKSKMYLELDKDHEPTRIEMDANVGEGVLSVRFTPDAQNNRNFTLETTDAGYTLKAFGLYDKIRGGKMSISGRPKKSETGDDLYGNAQLTDFAVKGAPALAKLISATSVKGVEALIDNDGLTFGKLASEFEWKFRDTGNLLVVKDGRTSGSSLGLTFEGFVNMGDGHMNLSGTIIPLAGVNKVIGQIPVIGDILTGGEALFAATYQMIGASSDPEISMNPLSVLAPGFLRKVLFEGDLETKVKKEESK